MQEVVGVVFRRLGKIYHFDPDGLSLLPGDHVVVRTQKGTEMGEVEEATVKLEEEHISQPLRKVVRRANEDDLARLEENRAKEAEAFSYGKGRIDELKLAMQLFQVERAIDGHKMTFYFTAENRVDFRDLVKDLSAHFKARIELRQIGVRDKAKMVGGFGHCGQNLCCSMWLDDLNPVSIRMAKEQDLSLNPIKISGVCGRLMCCLQYEYEAYKDFNKRAPGKGKCVETCSGHCGCVVHQNPVKEILKIRDDNGEVTEVPLSDVEDVFDQAEMQKRREAAAPKKDPAQVLTSSGPDKRRRQGPRRDKDGKPVSQGSKPRGRDRKPGTQGAKSGTQGTKTGTQGAKAGTQEAKPGRGREGQGRPEGGNRSGSGQKRSRNRRRRGGGGGGGGANQGGQSKPSS